MEETQIKLYPSNWLYNAGVIGFLKVLEKCGENTEDFLKDDGSVVINIVMEESKIFDNWDELTSEKLSSANKKVSYKNKTGGTKTFYYANQTEKLIIERIKKLLGKYCNDNKIKKRRSIYLICSFCGGEISNIAISKISALSQGFSKVLFTAEKTFPNSYWNNRADMFVCPKCEFIIFCHHIPMMRLTQEGEIFINAPSFKIMWYLNKFAEKVLTKGKEHQLRKILALSLMEFAQRVSVTLGAWSIMNIEMVIKKSNKIDYYFLPYEISKVILQKDVATLITETKEPIVLESVLNGKFDYLIKLTHKILRSLASGSDASKDNSLSELKNRNTSNLKRLSIILPELYAKIDSTLKKE